MRRLASGILLLLFLLLPVAAHAEKRVALLIGNQSYSPDIGKLANPHNDIALLEKALNGLKFDITTVRDADLATLHKAVSAHARRVKASGPNAIGFLYYAGHGAADGSTNYLIPVDVKSAEEGELWDASLRLNEITRKLKAEAGNATHFVVFDACRNNLKLRAAGTRALVQSRGFVPVAQEAGMLIAYATAEGESASDVGAGAGPYASVLAEEIVKPGVEAVTMFRNVQLRVRTAIGQEPWIGFSALNQVHLAGLAPPKDVAPPFVRGRLSEADEAWIAVKDTTNIIALETIMALYPRTPFADQARARIDGLKKEVTTKPTNLKPMPSATCNGVEVLVGGEKLCMRPGLGKVEWFKDCDTCPDMVVIPAGSFAMGSPANEPERESEFGRPGVLKGSESPQRQVTIAKPFAVSKSAITVDQFNRFVGMSGYPVSDTCWTLEKGGGGERRSRSFRDPGFKQSGDHPAVCVSWFEANAFVAWMKGQTGKDYRLLSEAEREYVTRAGSKTPFWWGSSISTFQANYNGKYSYAGGPTGDYRQMTVASTAYDPNPWGLYNVHGNVWEWTVDCWNSDYAGASTDASPRATGDCAKHVVRGGSWINHPGFLRAAMRTSYAADVRYNGAGFRVAVTLD